MQYAPVVIPTLNRFEHFTRCFESLEKCTGAEFTDVHIGLDYPPSEKYVEGWGKIDNYLKEKEKNNGFKTLMVYRRETNYFFSGKGNGKSIIEELLKKNDRYIFSEDDNIFSPNFLEFINKGLEKYKDDPTVLAICGYSHLFKNIKRKGNFYRQNVYFSAWGYGITKDKYEKLTKSISKQYFVRKLFSPLSLYRIIKSGPRNFKNFIIACSGYNGRLTDVIISLFMSLEHMDVTMPNVSLVRNMGFDGTGVHCQGYDYTNIIESQEIQNEIGFEYLGDGFDKYSQIHHNLVYHGISPESWSDSLKYIFQAAINKMFFKK